MTNKPDMIVYDPSQSQDVSFSYSYKNCASTSTNPVSTITLQKMSGTNTWADTTTASEKIQNNKTIPKGLSSTTKYRLKVVATAGTKSKEFYIPLQFIVKLPDMLTKGIPAYLLASKDYSYTFTINDFKNVADIAKVSLSFSCTLWGGGKCTKADSSDLTLSPYYTDSTKLLSIPANTLKADTCYSVGITIAYSGSINSKSVNMITAPSSIKTAISITFNFNAGQYFDVASSGFLGWKPQNNDIKLQDVTYSLSLLDSSGSAVTSSWLTTNSNSINYKANWLSSGTSYTFTCTITSKTDSTITGTAKQSFTTQSSVSISASITPTSGNQFTSFVISVTNSGSSSVKWNAGIVDSTVGEGFSPITTSSLQVSGQSSSSFSSVNLPVDTQSTSTTVKVLCKSPTVGDTGSASISVTMTKYTGSDASTLATAVISDISSCASSSSCADSDLLSKVVSNKQLITNMDASTAQSIGSKVISSLESTTLDTSDSQATKVYLSQIDAASSIASKGGLSSSQINSVTNVLQNVLGVSTSATTLADTTSTATADSVKSKNPTKGAESVNQLGTEDLKTLLNSLSKIMEGVESNKNQITSLDYENFKKTYMIIIDKIIKSSVNVIPTGTSMSFPFKGLAIYLENLATDSTSMNNQINLSYPWPWGSSYSPTTTATDPQALDGTIDPSTASTITATKQTQTTTTASTFTSASGAKLAKATADGMCSVTIPSLNTISTDISTWSTILVAVVTSSK